MPKKSVAGTAQDPTIQFATLTIDEDDYKLCFSFNALAEAESITGANLLEGLKSFTTGVTATQLRGLTFAAMKVARPDTTVEEVGSLLRFDTIPLVQAALVEAYNLSIPEKKKKDQDEQNFNV